MTISTRPLEPLDGESAPEASAIDRDPELRAIDESPAWPVTRLVGASLMLALGVSILAPAAIAADSRSG